MIAVQGIYENGRIELTESAPMGKAKVIVIFPEEKKKGTELSRAEARSLFEEFTGSIKGEIDEKEERLGALDEKYASFD